MSETSSSEQSASMEAQAQISIQELGSSDRLDRLPYSKVDVVKLCRIGTNYAFSFYQIDYQAAVNELLAGRSPQDQFIPVSKLVFDHAILHQFAIQINDLMIALASEAEAQKAGQQNDGENNA